MTTAIQSVHSLPHSDRPLSGPVALLLHGFGSHERDLAGLPAALDLTGPWVSLRAPIQLANGGAAWFEPTVPGSPDADQVADATESIWEWVDDTLDPDSIVVPIGFSQGGVMATQLLRTRPRRVLTPVVLGGYTVGHRQPGDEELTRTKPAVFWGRGANDSVISDAALDRSTRYLAGHSTLTQRIYPGLAHAIDRREVDDVRGFLRDEIRDGPDHNPAHS